MKLKKNDEVVIISGSEKGKTGFITKIDKKNNRVFVKDINKVVRHRKPSQQNTEGSIETIWALSGDVREGHMVHVKYSRPLSIRFLNSVASSACAASTTAFVDSPNSFSILSRLYIKKA